MLQIRSGYAGILICLILMACVGTTHAQSCPCWTLAELAAIRPAPLCLCQNDLDLGLAPEDTPPTCTSINGVPRGSDICVAGTCTETGQSCTTNDDCIPCLFGYPEHGWAEVWTGADIVGFVSPACLFWDSGQGITQRVFEDITVQQALDCALEIAAVGATAGDGSFCAIDTLACETDADCASTCSLNQLPCLTDPDCALIGTCSASLEMCETDDDCEGIFNFCQDFQSQTCNPQSCVSGCLSECFPSECNILPTPGASDSVDIVFTRQTFDVAQGDMFELRADADYSRAACTPAANDLFTDTLPNPAAGEARYYLLRAIEGVSCTDHGDSTLGPDPRDALDASCP